MNWDLISAVIFYALLFLMIYRFRNKFEVMQKIFFVHKTQRGINFMQKLAKLRPFWKVFSTIAIPVAIFFMIRIGQLLVEQIPGIFAGTAGGGVGIAIPGVKIPGSPIFIPFWYGIISIGVLAVVHEMSHGIVAAMEGVRIKSCGFGFLAILPLAFVELDEDQLKDMPTLTKLRILSSGSFGNIVLYLTLSVILIFAFSPFINSLVSDNGVLITSVEKGMPAQLAGIPENSRITAVNGQNVINVTQFMALMQGVSPGQNITLTTNISTYQLTAAANPKNQSSAYLGVYLDSSWQFTAPAKEKFGVLLNPIVWIYRLMFWIANLNFLIGIMNFLPIWFFDGGRIVYDSLGYIFRNEKVRSMIAFGIFSFYLVVLLLNIIGPYLMGLKNLI